MKFSFKLTLWFSSLLIISLIVILFFINSVAKSSVLENIENNLLRTVQTIDKLYSKRVQILQHNMQLLAGDYGFKSAYASEDEKTIHSALLNHKRRLKGSDFLILCDLDDMVLSNTYNKKLNNKPLVWHDVLDRANESEFGDITAVGVLDEKVYQLIVTPLLAPDIEAWIIGGFRLDNQTAKEFSDITGSKISFFQKEKEKIKLIASTINTSGQERLLTYLKMHDRNDESHQYNDGTEVNIGHYLELNNTLSPKISVFVSRSLDKDMLPYKKLSTSVLWIFLLTMVGILVFVFILSRGVSQSLVKLSNAAKSVAKGEFKTQVEVTNRDEFGLLSQTFNTMVNDLAEKEKVRNLLGKVVSPQVAHKLLEEGVELGGEEREVTVLFCDIEGFTQLSELKSPTEMLDALNTFFSGVSNIIEAHGGVVDKYIGDAVMAIFGAPLHDDKHASNAINCAIEMCKSADDLVCKLELENSYCNFGIGVHTGIVVAGNIGSVNRLNYTVIGDTVNVASRVEGQTRVFNTKLVATEATVKQCPHINFISLGDVKLKGRSEKIEVFTIK